MTAAFPVLHAVTDDRVLALPDLLDRAAALATGPQIAIHVRGTADGDRLLRVATRLGAVTRARGARLFVNDRVDVATLVGADGVHLPAGGLPARSARALLGERWIGRSAHSATEARAAVADGADYAMLGPIWQTASHPDREALGLEAIRGLRDPVVAIGGITAERAGECRAAGACGVAALSALWNADDPGAAVRRFLVSFAL